MLVAPDDDLAGRSTLTWPEGTEFDPTTVRLGPGAVGETLDRLVGNGNGRRVLELGCGDGGNAVALAMQGARVISVDPSSSRLARARAHAEAHDVRIEYHHGDLADLAFVRADQIDLCIAAYSLSEVEDVSRVFRQVERVLRTEAALLISLPHPLELMVADDPEGGAPRLTRAAFDASPVTEGGRRIVPHRITDIFTALTRSNFRVDALLEPAVDAASAGDHHRPAHDWVPATFVVRGRKQGI